MKKIPANKKLPRVRSVDFSGGVRGKHYKQFRASTVTVHLRSEGAEGVSGTPVRTVEYDFSKGVTGKYAARYRESAARSKTKRARRKPA